MILTIDPRSEDADRSKYPPPVLDLRRCARFHGVCADCPENVATVRRHSPKSTADKRLPPLAEQAIEKLSLCRGLTPRERQVLLLCCFGHKNRVIAAELGISLAAVRRHLCNLHRKTNTDDKSELILNLWHSCALHLTAGTLPQG
ncbi:MAG: hypothetical protein HUU22_07490 [Phycisphaerae bacterium]|nr:helix-turn-helix transcriptional regulator [Phycisphaerae bacterium]NUQ45860.1 hypothetical protein [Phycisphaerae bacterium]